MTRFDPSKFTASKAKPLPVMLVLDVSGSMNEVIGGNFKRTGQTVFEDGQEWDVVEGGETRLQILNQAVKDMITALSREEAMEHEFLVSAITFGELVKTHLSPTRASDVKWTDLEAAGETPLGEAISRAKAMIEDKSTTPSRAYRPVVVLVSDGRPTDEWNNQLAAFVSDGRSTKCDRMALAIGTGADEKMLGQFIQGTQNSVFHASDAEKIHEFFQRVTMSVTIRSTSKDPNQVPPEGDIKLGRHLAPAEGGSSKKGSSKRPSDEDDEGYW